MRLWSVSCECWLCVHSLALKTKIPKNHPFAESQNDERIFFYKIKKAEVSKIRMRVYKFVTTCHRRNKKEQEWLDLVTPHKVLKAQLGQKIKGDLEDSLLLQPLSYQLVESVTTIGKLYRHIFQENTLFAINIKWNLLVEIQ